MTSADTDHCQTASVRRRPARTAWDRVRAGLSLGVVLGLGATGTMAAWTDTATAESGPFGAAVIELTINDQPQEVVFDSIENLMPGKTIARDLVLANDGSVDLRYLMDMEVTGITTAVNTAGQQRGDATVLGSHLTLTVHESSTAHELTCPGPAIVSQLMTVGASRPVLTGHRTVNADAADTVCVQAKLAADAPIQSRMAQVGVTFTIDPEVV